MNRFPVLSVVVLALLLVLSFAFQLHAGEDLSSPFRFAIIGDRTGGHAPGIYEDIISEIDRLRPDFVLVLPT